MIEEAGVIGSCLAPHSHFAYVSVIHFPLTWPRKMLLVCMQAKEKEDKPFNEEIPVSGRERGISFRE
jgi:hypothetical protein